MMFCWGRYDSHTYGLMPSVRGGEGEGKQGQRAAEAGSHQWAGA